MPISPYSQAPFIVIWETTRACDLACKHCRAAAIPMRNPEELSTDEARRLIDDVATMRPQPNFVLTGGDPMKRPDLEEIIRYAARERGVRISITPSATPLVTPERIRACADAGLARWAFSIDGATAEAHDFFRGQIGSFAITFAAVQELARLRLPLQVNTTVSRYNLDSLPEIGRLVEELGAVLWSVFFLVPVGRGRADDALGPHETERVLQWLEEFARTSACDVKTTEAPQWRRVLRERRGDALSPLGDRGGRVGRAPRPVTDGDGFIFVSHKGEVYPSGFLPLVLGNVRERPLSEIYRNSEVLLALRDRSRLRGKCRICEYREICGGSRSRAYAITGDYLESDPYCPHQPDPAAGYRQIRLDVRERRTAGAASR